MNATALMLVLASCGQELARDAHFPLERLTSSLQEDGRRRWAREGEPFTGTAAEVHENGMRLVTELADGFEHGLHRLYFESGDLAREVPSAAGREHGRVRMWRTGGRPYVLEYKRAGESVGPQLRWSPTGELERFELRLEGELVPWTLENLARWDAAGCRAPAAHVLFWRAGLFARAGELEPALAELRASFEAGYPTPMDAIGLGVHEALSIDPGTRPKLIELWRDHARQSTLVMASPREPGTRLCLTVELVDADTGEPLPGAQLRLQHTDSDGFYYREDSEWNVRLVGIGRADEEGLLHVFTVLPGYYCADYDPHGIEPRHVHFETLAEGFRPYFSEARFSDDPRAANSEERRRRFVMEPLADGLLRGTLRIPLEKE